MLLVQTHLKVSVTKNKLLFNLVVQQKKKHMRNVSPGPNGYSLPQRPYQGNYHYFTNTCSISCARTGAILKQCDLALKASSCLSLKKRHNLQVYCG